MASRSAHWEEQNWGLYQKQKQQQHDLIQAAQKNSESTRQLLRDVGRTQAIASETLQELSKQTDQLQHIESKVDDIDNYLTFSERTVRGM